MLSRILPTAAIALLPIAVSAGPSVDQDCAIVDGSPKSCAPIVGCLGTEGLYFTGRALGWNQGAVVGTTNGGFTCSGAWKSRNAVGLGQAVFECDNGLTGVAYFLSQDGATGTAKGRGRLSNGQSLRVWTGHNIRQFLVNKTGDVNAALLCGDVEIPLS